MVLADAMGWAYQGPLLTAEKGSGDYGVWCTARPRPCCLAGLRCAVAGPARATR